MLMTNLETDKFIAKNVGNVGRIHDLWHRYVPDL